MRAILRALPLLATAIVSFTAALTVGAHDGPGTKVAIADLTPTDALVVMSVEDWPKARAAFNNSIYGRLWQDQAVKDFVWELLKSESKTDRAGPEWLAGELKEMGVDADDLREPTGPAGAAMFFEAAPADGWPAKAGDTKPGASPDRRPQMHMIAAAEFGEGAEAMDGVIEKLAAELKKKGHATLDEEQHEGQTIRIIRRVDKTPDADANAEDEDLEFDDGRSGPWNSDAMGDFRVAKVGTAIIATTSKSAMHAAIDRLLGKGGKESDTLAGSKTYQAALAQHPRDIHGSMVIIAGPTLRASMREGMAAMGALSGAPMRPDSLMDALGLGSLEAFSLGMRLETDAGSAEQTLGVLASEKKGLLTMLDSVPAAGAGFSAPPFAAADCASLTTLSVRFDRLMDVIRGIIKSMPEEMLPPNAAKAAEDAVTPFVSTLDNEVSIVSSYRRPLSAESSRVLIAIKLKDALGLANLVTGFAGQIGAELRDFQGNQIFEMPESPVSMGIGAGYAYVGPVEDIENAMRLAADPSLPRLGGSERFKAAAAAVAPGGAMYGFTSMSETLAYMYWEFENAEKIFEKELDDLELEADEKRDALDGFRKDQPAWLTKLPPASTLNRHMGDTVFDFRSTPDGFRGRWLLLRPGRE